MNRKEIIGNATLYLDDCMDILPTLGKVEAIVTDPSYDLHIGFDKNSKWGKTRDYGQAIIDNKIDLGYEIELLPKVDNIITFCMGKGLKEHLEYAEKNGYRIKLITWNKTNPSPLCENIYPNATEYIFHYWKKGKLYGDFKTRKTFYVSASEKNDFDHPTVKPLWLMQSLIQNCSLTGQTILDPFMGSGTTGVACYNMARKFIGIEKNEKYFDIACKRIELANLQQNLDFSGGEV